MVLDEIFGKDNFRNEIIWCYQGTGKSLKQYKRKHDTLWFYSRGDSWIFNSKEIGIPFGEKQIKKFSGQDESGFYKEYRHTDGKVYKKYLSEDEELVLVTGLSQATIRSNLIIYLLFPGLNTLGLLHRN